MEVKEKIDRANDLRERIKFIDDFIEDVGMHSASAYTTFFLKKNVETSFSIIGHRTFGTGCHTRQIMIPKKMAFAIVLEAEKQKKEYEDELEKLFT